MAKEATQMQGNPLVNDPLDDVNDEDPTNDEPKDRDWKNVAKENERKLDDSKKDLEAGRAELSSMRTELATMKGLVETVKNQQSTATPEPAKTEASVEDDDFYTDPKSAIKKMVAQEILPEIKNTMKDYFAQASQGLDLKQKQASFDSQATAKYPELNDQGSDFYAKWLEVGQEMIQRTPALNDDPSLSLTVGDIVASRHPGLIKKEDDADDGGVSMRDNVIERGGVSSRSRSRTKKGDAMTAEEKQIFDRYKRYGKSVGVDITPEMYTHQLNIMRMNKDKQQLL